MADLVLIYDIHSATDSTNLLQCRLLYGNLDTIIYMKKTALQTAFKAGIPILNRKQKRYATFEEIFKL